MSGPLKSCGHREHVPFRTRAGLQIREAARLRMPLTDWESNAEDCGNQFPIVRSKLYNHGGTRVDRAGAFRRGSGADGVANCISMPASYTCVSTKFSCDHSRAGKQGFAGLCPLTRDSEDESSVRLFLV
jgi:hypothetical protein